MIENKLKNNRGVSMAFALVVLLLCAMVGGALLTAASVNAGKTERNRVAQQNYLSVSSAARMVVQELKGMSFAGGFCEIHTTTTTVTSVPTGEGETETSTSVQETADKEKTTSTLQGSRLFRLLEEQLGNLFYGNSDLEGHVGELSFEMDFEADEALGIRGAKGLLKVGTDYKITVVLKDEEGGNPLVVEALPVVSTDSSTTLTSEQTPEIGGISTSKTVRRIYHTVTIDWNDVTIKEGDL